MTQQEIRDEFLVKLFDAGEMKLVYSDIDRAICGSVVPLGTAIELSAAEQLRADFFCQRRELGILNIGAAGKVVIDDTTYDMDNLDCLYVGVGSKAIRFASDSATEPAKFYLLSYPAHKAYPTKHIKLADAKKVEQGSAAECNERTIYQMIHPDVLPTCQLVMGVTILASGSIWNTMPAHTHERRMEVYLYFNMAESTRVFHLMGRPDETRHVIMADGQAVISPSWSIHSGAGTSSYTFCWGMGGENQTFTDMDHLTPGELK
jgi:4-deoxy-L-threo-5-hexosulose-uronate ketol-isomerase